MPTLDPGQKAKLLERYQAELERLERELPQDAGIFDFEVAVDELGQRLLGETLGALESSRCRSAAPFPPELPRLLDADAPQRPGEPEGQEPLG